MEKGKLYLVATPIGNLEDMSVRAIKTLKEVDLILCEDTRHSGKLLKHFDIKARLMSYHEHNERSRGDQVIEILLAGQNVGLISDAGMPCISDPGSHIVDLAHEEGIEVVPIPGPSAMVAAVAVSGFSKTSFQFLGFLSRKAGEKKLELESTINYPGLSIIYESPNRLMTSLEAIRDLSPSRRVLVAREITKLNEEFYRGRVEDAIEHFSSGVRGEIVLVLDEYFIEEDLDLEEELRKRIGSGVSASRAAKDLAKEYGISKNDLYDLSIKIAKDL